MKPRKGSARPFLETGAARALKARLAAPGRLDCAVICWNSQRRNGPDDKGEPARPQPAWARRADASGEKQMTTDANLRKAAWFLMVPAVCVFACSIGTAVTMYLSPSESDVIYQPTRPSGSLPSRGLPVHETAAERAKARTPLQEVNEQFTAKILSLTEKNNRNCSGGTPRRATRWVWSRARPSTSPCTATLTDGNRSVQVSLGSRRA